MCMFDGDGSGVLLGDSTPKARKPHKCCECGREIQIGEQYSVQSGIWEGDFYSYKTCGHCAIAKKWLQEECGGYIYESVSEDMREHFRNGSGLSVGRIIIGMRRKWMGRKGPLPLPKMPPVTPYKPGEYR